MKILMTADAVGGVLNYTLELVEGLAEHDVEVVLALLGPSPSREQRRRIAAVPLAGYGERGYALEWMEEPWEDVDRGGYWLLELADAAQPDLVHLNGFAYGALELGRPKVVVGHSCVLSWHEAVRGGPAGPARRRYRDAVTAGIHGANALVAPTRALLDELKRLYRPRCVCRAIPNGMAPVGLAPGPKEPFVLGVGRVWDEAKNLAALERIAPRLGNRVVIVGDGSPLGRLDTEEIRDLYARAAVFAAPGLYEPFGLAALEAGLAGCALVLGDLATYREVWGEAATYVDPTDDDTLVRELAWLLDEPRERDRRGRAARERALTYSRERMAVSYLDLYHGLAARTDRFAAALEVA
jgi:glycogen synthase